MKLQPLPFNQIKKGNKNIEIRLYDDKRKLINVGDTIVFKKEPEQEEVIKVEVTNLYPYETFIDLIKDFEISVFGYENKDELIKDIYSFYTKEQESEHGVIGIEIKLLENKL